MDITGLIPGPEVELIDWAGRCEYWQRKSDEKPNKRKRREKETRGLILAGHGISITVHRGTLLIQDGNTHYPGQKRTYRFFKGDLSLPPRIVLLDGSGAITLEALDWLAEQGADLIRLKWNGHIRSVSSASGYAANIQKVNWQIETRSNEAKRVAFAIPLLAEKIKSTVSNLETYFPDSRERDNALKIAKTATSELRNKPPKTVAKLHAIEGAVAGRYFIAWNTLPIKWKADKRRPIPDDWRTYLSRTALVTDKTFRNYGATHPINAMLNYAYTVLEATMRIKAIADGYDPTIGIMHDRTRGTRHSFVFDLMEPQRPVADRTILKLVTQETFCGSDFVLQRDGVCRLNPTLAGIISQGTDAAIKGLADRVGNPSGKHLSR